VPPEIRPTPAVRCGIQSNMGDITTRVLASLTPREERIVRMRVTHVPVVRAKLTNPTCDLYIETINSFISAAVGSHPHGELNNRTLEQHSAENCVHFFRNAAVTAISCLWTGHGRQGSTCVRGCASICGLSSSVGRMSVPPQLPRSEP
jgi:hypothetical protein